MHCTVCVKSPLGLIQRGKIHLVDKLIDVHLGISGIQHRVLIPVGLFDVATNQDICTFICMYVLIQVVVHGEYIHVATNAGYRHILCATYMYTAL